MTNDSTRHRPDYPKWPLLRGIFGAFLTMVVAAGLLAVPGVARADESAYQIDRLDALEVMVTGEANVARAAEVALVGTDEDVRAFLATGYREARDQDDRVKVEGYLALGGPAMKVAAQAALNGTAADRRAFLDTGWLGPWARRAHPRVAGHDARRRSEAVIEHDQGVPLVVTAT